MGLLSNFLLLGLVVSPLILAKPKDFNTVEQNVAKFIERAENELHELAKKSVIVEWAYNVDITDHNEKIKLEQSKVSNAVSLRLGKEAQQFDIDQVHDKDLKRKLEGIQIIGTSILSPEKLERYNHITNEMSKIYNTAKFSSYDDPEKFVRISPDMYNLMGKLRDPKALEYYWSEWRKHSGEKMRKMYLEMIELTNEAAKLNGFKDGTEMKVFSYESDTFVEEMEETWQGLKPLYEQLHAYVRNKLVQFYGEEHVDPTGPLPGHLMGDPWAQKWNLLADILRPFPDKPDIDVTDEMAKQGWTQKTMFKKADEYFQSLGLEPMTEKFWKNSLIKKPDDGRELVCQASAWDFYVQDDFRIKMCTEVKQDDLFTVYHEMGHTQYQMSYRNQSYLYRSGANPGFHEGIADILGLASGTTSNLRRMGLLTQDIDDDDEETTINLLFNTALSKVAFMPFLYVVDRFRWDMYSGVADPEDLNCHWVKQRLDIHGIAPANQRNEKQFDAGSKFHVAANIGYIRYFTAHIYQFQFYRELCLVSGQYDPNDPEKPLHRCNFYGSKEAGQKLFSLMKLGASVPWKEAIEQITGKPEMSTDAYRDYFRPLENWLIKENEKNGVKVGWEVKDYEKYCKKQPEVEVPKTN